ncbi:hypothetical protein CIY45_003058 [Salmonella enterica subsp. enterica serovar Enteritidis]|nr:hypothetical protein [Salmonella enterica subsp. enterica serovar Enteritidis]
MDLILQKRLKELLHYDPETGVFTWLRREGKSRAVSVFNSNYAGKVAGNIQTDSSGHKQVSIYFDKKAHKAHRLAWLYVYGKMPKGIIDHINGDSLDNRIVNLREADDFQSAWNKGKLVTNKSGYKGVSLKKKSGKWVAQINYKGKKMFLGYHDTPEEAHKDYCEAAVKLHGEFAKLS